MNKKIFAPHALAALFLLSAGSSWADEATSPATTSFDIPPQNLEAALIRFSEQSDIQLVMASADVDGKEVEGVVGDLTHQEALVELLDNTGLEYRFVNDETVAIGVSDEGGDSDSKNLSPTPVLMTYHHSSETQTRTSAETSNALESAESQTGGPVMQLEEIIVTGTNIRGVQNPTVQILQFDRDDIEISGAATVEEFLRVIPQNFAVTNPVSEDGSNDFAAGTLGASTAVDLRGLGAGSTLTLLNGRRMTVTGVATFVDVSLLPLGALERVEVVPDGASAIYGSDAVAGVVNFITRKDFEGLEINGRYGTVTDGSREEYSIGGAGGLTWSGGGGMIGIEYLDQQPLLTTERDFFDLSLANPEGTIGTASERFSAIGSWSQAASDKLSFEVDALYSSRESEFTQNLNAQLAIGVDQEAIFINSRANYDLSERLSASLFYDFSREDLTQIASLDDQRFYENSLHLGELQITGSLADMPSGTPLSFATGAIYREENYQFSDLVGSSDTPPTREVFATYAEFLVPVIGAKNALPFVQKLDFSVAGRYEDYSDFGDTFNPKIGVRWAVSSDLNIRASFSESFRAPTLPQVSRREQFSVVALPSSFFTGFTPPPPTDALSGSRNVGLLNLRGEPDLGPENADVWTAGIEFAPSRIPGLILSSTYFNVSYNERLENISFFPVIQEPQLSALFIDLDPDPAVVADIFARGEAGEILFSNFFDLDPSDVQFGINSGLYNVAVRSVEGFDFTASYERETAVGVFATSLNASYLTEFERQLTPDSNAVEDLNVLYRPVDLRLRGVLSWSRGGFTASGAINYTSDYEDNTANSIDAWTTVDLNLSYETPDALANGVLEGTRFGINLRNSFDEEPPFALTPDGFNYDTSNADPFGRFVSVSLSKSF